MEILVINSGSTSIKFKLFNMPEENVVAEGKIENIGQINTLFTFISKNFTFIDKPYKVSDHKTGLNMIIDLLSNPPVSVIKNKNDIDAIGHRYVNIGDRISSHCIIDEEVIEKIKESLELAPLHNPANLMGIEVSMDLFKNKPNVVVFDNIFHKDIPSKAYLYGIPYDYYEKYRIRKYGFHGIAYTYMVSRVSELLGIDYKKMKIVAIMLGGGSSITAIKNGKTMDTSMGFTPAEGLFMSTRSGDMDPAIIGYLMKKEDLNPAEMDEIINQKSGLLGLSRKYKNFIDIEKGVEEKDPDCIRAFDSYVFRIKKYIGSYAAIMNGLDLIIFGGGIGENSSITRESILDDMTYFGIIIDKNKNKNLKGEQIISTSDSKVPVAVVKVNEEIIIARETYNMVMQQKN
ncbi:MAG: acetate kinase [Actinobacteria bacterium]|nr:acetate kinase [Cyanobacteriota bacterium]MCL5771155.1 acetate kinase [Actinomycetota bacterium]